MTAAVLPSVWYKAMVEMHYCMQCGGKLELRKHESEGIIPWCESCGDWRFPVFNTAVSMIITNRTADRVLLIQQYGKPTYIFVAGYVNKGEDAETAAIREVREELGMTVTSLQFNHSRYFPPSNTLMLNFTVTVAEEDAHPNEEIDAWRWFSLEEAEKNIRPNSLAAAFLYGWLSGCKEYHFPVYE